MFKYIVVFNMIVSMVLAGCSYTLHKREKDPSNPADLGSETKFQLRGPRAAVQHKF